jgi:predicted ester cyclase
MSAATIREPESASPIQPQRAGAHDDADERTPADATPRDLGRRFFESQDRTKGGPAAELCAPGYVASIAGFPAFDRAGHEAFASAFYAAFPDLHHAIEEVVAADGRIAVRFTLTGTHSGDFDGIAPTGRSIRVAAIALLQVAEGRVRRVDGVFDQLGLLRQLGVLPSP